MSYSVDDFLRNPAPRFREPDDCRGRLTDSEREGHYADALEAADLTGVSDAALDAVLDELADEMIGNP